MQPEFIMCQMCHRLSWASYKNGNWICRECGEVIDIAQCKECHRPLAANEHDYCSLCVSGAEHRADLGW